MNKVSARGKDNFTVPLDIQNRATVAPNPILTNSAEVMMHMVNADKALNGDCDLSAYAEKLLEIREWLSELFEDPGRRPSDGKALLKLIGTIESTGGLVRFEDGSTAPEADIEWLDMADTYLAACKELERTPKIKPYDESSPRRWANNPKIQAIIEACQRVTERSNSPDGVGIATIEAVVKAVRNL